MFVQLTGDFLTLPDAVFVGKKDEGVSVGQTGQRSGREAIITAAELQAGVRGEVTIGKVLPAANAGWIGGVIKLNVPGLEVCETNDATMITMMMMMICSTRI